MPFLFLYHGLEIELFLQVCLRFFVFSFSIVYLFEDYKSKWSFFYEYVQTHCRTAAWMARTLDFRVSINQWFCLCCGWWTVCAHCVCMLAVLSSGQFASLQFFGFVICIAGSVESDYRKVKCQQDTCTHTGTVQRLIDWLIDLLIDFELIFHRPVCVYQCVFWRKLYLRSPHL